MIRFELRTRYRWFMENSDSRIIVRSTLHIRMRFAWRLDFVLRCNTEFTKKNLSFSISFCSSCSCGVWRKSFRFCCLKKERIFISEEIVCYRRIASWFLFTRKSIMYLIWHRCDVNMVWRAMDGRNFQYDGSRSIIYFMWHKVARGVNAVGSSNLEQWLHISMISEKWNIMLCISDLQVFCFFNFNYNHQSSLRFVDGKISFVFVDFMVIGIYVCGDILHIIIDVARFSAIASEGKVIEKFQYLELDHPMSTKMTIYWTQPRNEIKISPDFEIFHRLPIYTRKRNAWA